MALLMQNVLWAHEFQGEVALRSVARIDGDESRLNYAGSRMQLRYEHHTRDFSIYSEGRFRWNGVFMGDNPYSRDAREAYEFSFDLREAFVRLPVPGNFDLSLGWQQVVWGKADQLRILDQINPLDIREFVLLDMKDYRMPIPMVRLNGMVDKWETEFLYIPTHTPMYFAEAGSEYAIPLIPAAPGLRELSSVQYDSIGQGASAGFRFSRAFQGLDIGIVGLYARDYQPVFSQSFGMDADGPYLGLREEHHRYFMAGANFEAPLGSSYILRGEAAYVPARTFMLEGISDGNGLERHGEVTAMLALDYTYQDWVFSAQLMDRAIIDWHSGMMDEEHTPTFTVSAQGINLGGHLETRVFWATMPVTDDGSWLQIKNTYLFDDHWATSLVMDFLQGPKDGFFGQLKDRDRVGLEFSYRF